MTNKLKFPIIEGNCYYYYRHWKRKLALVRSEETFDEYKQISPYIIIDNICGFEDKLKSRLLLELNDIYQNNDHKLLKNIFEFGFET
jgi:hypothetical protein